MGFLGFLGTPLGYLLKFIYDLVNSYGWALIIFTILVRLASFPLQIKQQKSTARMSAYQPMITEIQKKYAKDKEKQNQELMKMQEEYGYNPMAGCLPMLLNFVVMFGIIEAVYYPLQHILHISKETLSQVASSMSVNNDMYFQSNLIQQIQAGVANVGSLLTPEQIEAIKNFNVVFMGIDLTQKPELALNSLLIFPILSVLSMALVNVITMKMSGQEMTGSMKWMPWIMSLMFVWFGFTVPVAFSLYYTVSNLLMLATSMISKKMYDPEKMKQQVLDEIEEKKKAKKAKKQVKIVEENGKEVVKEVSETELVRIRLEMARKLDEEKYKDERTVPLSEFSGSEEE